MTRHTHTHTQRDTHTHTHTEGGRMHERVEKGMSGVLLLQAVFWGDATPQHTHTHKQTHNTHTHTNKHTGQPEVLNHRLLDVLNIGGLIGSVEKGRLGSVLHTHTH